MNTIKSFLVLLLAAAFSFTSHGLLTAVTIDIPEEKIIAVMNEDISYLIAANKVGLQARDSALISAALLKAGVNGPAREWLDSQPEGTVLAEGECGEYVFVLRNYIDYSGDRAYLKSTYPKAAKILKSFRAVRGNWDDLFVLRGFNDGEYLAGLMGDKEGAGEMRKKADSLRKYFSVSVRQAAERDRSDYTPAIACAATGELECMPKELFKDGIDNYFAEFSEGMISVEQRDFGLYELYLAGAYFRLDQRARGLAIVRYFAESPSGRSGRNRMETAHGYIDAVTTMFVYDDEGKLILGEGLAPEWFDRGIEVKDLPTPYGKICYVIKKDGPVIRYFIYGTAKPPKGVRFVLPKELSGCKIEEMKAKQ